jgi:hypothetical protein
LSLRGLTLGLVDAGWLEWRALVRAAARVAFMVRLAIFPTLAAADGAVIGQQPTAAQAPTAPQLGIQHIKDVDAHLELAELHLAEYRPDDPLDVALVAGPGVELEFGDLQPSVDQVADRGLDLWLAALSDRLDQVCLPGLGLVQRGCEVVGVPVTLCDRIPAEGD